MVIYIHLRKLKQNSKIQLKAEHPLDFLDSSGKLRKSGKIQLHRDSETLYQPDVWAKAPVDQA